MNVTYDKIIFGAGIYGLYAALYSGRKGENVLVIEKESTAFSRATLINQARVHMGYHYPRSFSTAGKSAHYFKRFNDAYGFSILKSFDQIYATSSHFSWTDAEDFIRFCRSLNIKCEPVPSERYFKPNTVDGCFLTEEYTYDAEILKKYFLDEIKKYPNVTILYDTEPISIEKHSQEFEVELVTNHPDHPKSTKKCTCSAPYILNATYASVNQVLSKVHGVSTEPFKIKYELCEVILCTPKNPILKRTGLTVMDGPFFSIMPFGKTGYHSLTSVSFTPHLTSFDKTPTFPCQKFCPPGYCSPDSLGNCNNCSAAPHTSFAYMSNLAKKYLNDDLEYDYVAPLFSMKPILNSSEIDDSRPTVIKKFCDSPTFISVLSGKVNTIFDLDEVL